MPAALGRRRHRRRQPRLVASRAVDQDRAGATALGFLVPAAVAYSIEETWLAGVVAVAGVYLSTLVATYVAVALAAGRVWQVLEGDWKPSP